MLTQLKAILPDIIHIAREAGQKITEIYQSDIPIAVSRKEDQSPVTAADIAAHHIINNQLQQFSWPVLSEEGIATAFAARAGWDPYWLVDPLDGTKEFIGRTGEFTVNIALISQHQPWLGVVDVPQQNTTYFAIRGQGAYKQHCQSPPEKITTCPWEPSQKIRVIVSKRHNLEKLGILLQRFAQVEILIAGSSLKSCLIAEGKADLYLRPGATSEWDTAASQIILEEAGGIILDWQGQPLRYNMHDHLDNPWFFAAGDPRINWLDYLTTP